MTNPASSSLAVLLPLLLRIGVGLSDLVIEPDCVGRDCAFALSKAGAAVNSEDRERHQGHNKTGALHHDDAKVPQVGGECALYLAESSIPNAGLGMYTGVPLKRGDEVGDADLYVPIPDYDYSRFGWWLVEEVQWDPTLHDEGMIYYEALGVPAPETFYPGFGAQINCHMAFNNVEHNKGKYDSVRLHRSRDPGVGAFTPYHSMPTVATTDIEAGSELFTDYGEEWFLDREHLVGKVPFERDFAKSNRIMQAMEILLDSNDSLGKEASDGIWNLVRNASDDRLRNALPQNVSDLHSAIQVGAARHSLPNLVRSSQWLRDNGVCIDNLYAKESKIPQAGRGAFAKRFLAKGSIIAPSPVMQIPREKMNMHETFQDENTGQVKYSDKVVRQQLLLNYCYGRPDSPVLLLPYAPMVGFINHDGRDANAKIRWSGSSLNRREWLDLPPEELFKNKFGLMMEFVALRDIQEGEEVLVDYGPEWEQAWSRHIEQWVAPEDSEDYVSAFELNSRRIDVRTEHEQVNNPYPKNVETGCWYMPVAGYSAGEGLGGDGVHEVRLKWGQANKSCLRPCKILSRYIVQGVDYFTAEMLSAPSAFDESCVIPKGEKHIVSHIPSDTMKFVDRMYTRDPFIPNAFRHEIGIPEDEFPSAWRNK